MSETLDTSTRTSGRTASVFVVYPIRASLTPVEFTRKTCKAKSSQGSGREAGRGGVGFADPPRPRVSPGLAFGSNLLHDSMRLSLEHPPLGVSWSTRHCNNTY